MPATSDLRPSCPACTGRHPGARCDLVNLTNHAAALLAQAEKVNDYISAMEALQAAEIALWPSTSVSPPPLDVDYSSLADCRTGK